MSDAFAGIDYGTQSQLAIEHGRKRAAEYAVKAKKIATEATIEKGLGSAKLLITGKKISEETVKAVKPYVKQQLRKGLESAKGEAKSFAEKWAGKSEDELAKASEGVLTKFQNPTFNPTGNVFGELQQGDIAAVPDSSLPADGSMTPLTSSARVGGGKPLETIQEEGGEARTARETQAVAKEDEADTLEAQTAKADSDAISAGYKSALDKDISPRLRKTTQDAYSKMGQLRDEAKNLRKINDAEPEGLDDVDPVPVDITEDLGEESGTLASTAAAEGSTLASTAVSGAKASIAAAKAGIQTAKDSVAAAKAAAEKLAAKGVEKGVGEDIGEITAGETAGAVLDAIPGLNWLGLIVGAATTAAGVEEMKHKPKMPPMPVANFSGTSFQVGVN